MQPILTNFFAGVVLAIERPFRINDWIQVNDYEGMVTKMTWRTTYIRTRDNDNIIFPNANIAQETIINFLYPHPLHLVRVYVGAHYRTPPYRIQRALLDAAGRVEGVLDNPIAAVYVTDFAESSIQYELRIWIDDMARLPKIASEARQEVWEEFRRAGIVIPFPIRTLEMAAGQRIDVGEPQALKTTPGPYAARLFVALGKRSGAAVELGKDPITIGRSHNCVLMVAEPMASKQHCTVEWDNGAYVMRDVDSTHGTKVNGRRVQACVLKDLDRIQIADTEIVFESHGH